MSDNHCTPEATHIAREVKIPFEEQRSVAIVSRSSPAPKSGFPNHLSFAHNLRNLLLSANMSNKEFAKLVNTSEGTVSRWVHGKQRPGRRRIAAMERLLAVDPGTLGSLAQETLEDSTRPDPAASPFGESTPQNGPPTPTEDEKPDTVMLEFNRWLEPFIRRGCTLRPVDAVEWMQRMWRANSFGTSNISSGPRRKPLDQDIELDIDVQPGTGIAITTVSGRMVVVNQALADILELTREEIVGCYVWEFNAAEYREVGKARVRDRLTAPWDVELVTGSSERTPVTISNVFCHLNGCPVRVALVKRRSPGNAG